MPSRNFILLVTAVTGAGAIAVATRGSDENTNAHASKSAASALAEDVLAANPSPVRYVYKQGYRTAKLKPGKTQFYGCATDDPWVHPHVDAFKGAKSGWDVYLTVDTAARRPGAGEVDAHVGIYNAMSGYRGDKPGDLFILGNARGPFYAGKQASSDPDRDFVYVYGFERDASTIRLHGQPTDYLTSAATDPETGLAGTALFYTAGGTHDLIAWIADWEPHELPLDGPRFQYAQPPGRTPATAGIDQLGNGGVHSFGVSAVDPAGHKFVTFLSSGPPFAGATGEGSFHLVKYAPNGNRLWIRRHGVPVDEHNGGELPYAIAANERFVFIAGHTKGAFGGPAPQPVDNIASHAFIARFDANDGMLQQVRQLTKPGENGNAWSLALDDAGEYLFVGGGDSDNGPRRLPHTSPFVAKLRQNDLATVWRKVLVDGRPFTRFRDIRNWQISNEAIGGIAFDADAPGGAALYVSGYGAQGDFLGGKRGVTSCWTARFDMAGNRVWGHAFFADQGEQYPFATAVDEVGDVYVIGQTQGSLDGAPYGGQGDGFVRKIRPDGKHIWTTLVGGPDADELQDLVLYGDDLFVTGSTHSALDGPSRGLADGFIARLDATTGRIRGHHQFGTELGDYPRSMNLHPSGDLIISGTTEGSLVRPASGGWDVFLMRRAPDVE